MGASSAPGADPGPRAGLLLPSRVLAGDGHVARQARTTAALGGGRGAVAELDVSLLGRVQAAGPVLDPEFWRDRRVLVTGHTGFKGSWLTLWLQSLGSRVSGLSCGMPSEPSLYEVARGKQGMAEEAGADLRTVPSVDADEGRAAP